MSPRFYTGLWIVSALAALITAAVGSMTMFAGVVFGFLVFGLIFVGMMCVLPGVVAHSHEQSIHETREKRKAKAPEATARAKAFTLESA